MPDRDRRQAAERERDDDEKKNELSAKMKERKKDRNDEGKRNLLMKTITQTVHSHH